MMRDDHFDSVRAMQEEAAVKCLAAVPRIRLHALYIDCAWQFASE